MGGGLELALGCHYRVAAPGAQIALPEVKIGLIPGAGGTQRLPRVLGVETALNMIVSGEPVKSEMLAKLPGQKLFDKMVEGDVVDGAVAFAREKADAPAAADRPQPARSSTRTPTPTSSSRATPSARCRRNFPAPLKCVDAVAASATDEVRRRHEARARALHGADADARVEGAAPRLHRRARGDARSPTCPADTPTRAIKKVAVIGAGTMGGGIAMNFLNAGIPVVMLEMKQEALDKGIGDHAQELRGAGQEGQAQAGQARRAHGPAQRRR